MSLWVAYVAVGGSVSLLVAVESFLGVWVVVGSCGELWKVVERREGWLVDWGVYRNPWVHGKKRHTCGWSL